MLILLLTVLLPLPINDLPLPQSQIHWRFSHWFCWQYQSHKQQMPLGKCSFWHFLQIHLESIIEFWKMLVTKYTWYSQFSYSRDCSRFFFEKGSKLSLFFLFSLLLKVRYQKNIGIISQNFQWRFCYLHCPKNVLRSILSFVFWIFRPWTLQCS